MTVLRDIWRIGGASARLTRAVVADDIGERLIQRPAEIAWPDGESAPRVLLSCPWCIGFWITLAVLIIERTPVGRSVTWRVLTTALAAHWTVTHIAMALGDYDEVGDDDDDVAYSENYDEDVQHA